MNSQQELMSLVSPLFKEKKLIIWVVIMVTLIGTTYALLKQNEYEVQVTMIPKSVPASRSNRFAGLASLAGISLRNPGDNNNVSPLHYSYLMSSVPFKKGLLELSVYSESLDSSLSLRDYINVFRGRDRLKQVQSNTIGLPKKLLSSNKKEGISESKSPSDTLFAVSKSERSLLTYLKNRIKIKYDQIEGTLQLTTNMPEPTVATQLSLYVQNHLGNELIRIQKDFELKSLDFIEELFELKRSEFEDKQRRLAEFEDSNRVISSSVARSQLRKLESEYEIAFNVYSDIAQQLESKKIDVLNNLPAFSVIKPAVVPNKKTSPKRMTICIVSGIVGVILGVFFALGKVLFVSFRAEYRARVE